MSKFSFLMITALIAASSASAAPRFVPLAGHGAGNGGEVVLQCFDPQRSMLQAELVLLDLAEYGIEASASVHYSSFEGSWNPPMLAGYRKRFLIGSAKAAFGADGFYDQCPVKRESDEQCPAPFIIDDEQLTAANAFRLAGGEIIENTKVFTELVNKIYEVRTVEPAFAESLLNGIKRLNWHFINMDLVKTGDSNTPIIGDVIRQIAVRDEVDVRISRKGWMGFSQKDVAASCGSSTVDPNSVKGILGTPSAPALITHEIIYADTAASGDFTSDRARKINAYIYMGRADRIRAAWDLFLQASPDRGKTREATRAK